jgi:hypothetical protein
VWLVPEIVKKIRVVIEITVSFVEQTLCPFDEQDDTVPGIGGFARLGSH